MVMERHQPLSELAPERRATVVEVGGEDGFRHRLLELGFTPGTTVVAELIGPFGDPRSYRVRDTVVALRRGDAERVNVVPVEASPPRETRALVARQVVHSMSPRRDVADVRAPVVLAGNPNTGKSTVFNALTGLRQHVGNWPGKTVARATGRFTHGERVFRLVDLPGTYSLLARSPEEEIARDVLVFRRPICTVVVIDATRLERNLNLALQILEITAKVVVCLNLVDEARAFGIRVDHEALSDRLGVPVVPTVARTGRGLGRLRETIHKVVTGAVATRPAMTLLPDKLEAKVVDLTERLARKHPEVDCPRWLALRLVDDDRPDLRAELLGKLELTGTSRAG